MKLQIQTINHGENTLLFISSPLHNMSRETVSATNPAAGGWLDPYYDQPECDEFNPCFMCRNPEEEPAAPSPPEPDMPSLPDNTAQLLKLLMEENKKLKSKNKNLKKKNKNLKKKLKNAYLQERSDMDEIDRLMDEIERLKAEIEANKLT